MTHDKKSCMERPRTVGAKWTNMQIAPDEKVESFELDYDGKRDRWNGYDPSTYTHVIAEYEAREEARKKYLKEQQLKKLEEKNGNQDDNDVGSDEDTENGLKIDEAKVDESNQMDFAKWRSMCVQQVVEALELWGKYARGRRKKSLHITRISVNAKDSVIWEIKVML